MSWSLSRKRPWLAALLGALVTGLGHLYLRRWWRALGWLATLVGVSTLFVDPSTLEALASGSAVDPFAVAPILIVGILNVIDAYVLALAHNAVVRLSAHPEQGPTHCPNCGKEVDTDLDFCQWCSTELPDMD